MFSVYEDFRLMAVVDKSRKKAGPFMIQTMKFIGILSRKNPWSFALILFRIVHMLGLCQGG